MAVTWTHVGTGNAHPGLSPSLPAGCQEGDLLVLCLSHGSPTTIGWPSGWEEIAHENEGNDLDTPDPGAAASSAMAWIIHGASPPPTTITLGGGSYSGRVRGTIIMAYRADEEVIGLSTFSSNTLSTSDASPSTGSLTTDTANTLLVAFGSCEANVNTGTYRFTASTDPSTTDTSTTLDTDPPTVGLWQQRRGVGGGFGIGDAVKGSAGATGTITTTGSSTPRQYSIYDCGSLQGHFLWTTPYIRDCD
jgi:hypothetical protein